MSSGANNPRKFKDRIALLNQKEAESTAQFQAVMRDVSEVRTHTLQPHGSHHYSHRYGGSLPNVNQMASPSNPQGALDIHNSSTTGLPSLGALHSPSLPSEQALQYQRNVGDYGLQSNRGGGAIRNRSSERQRWVGDSSPYETGRPPGSGSGGGGGGPPSPWHSYLSPPPESRWRRTSSDSALYQKLTQVSVSGDTDSNCEPHGPPTPNMHPHPSSEAGFNGTDVKPSPEILTNLLLKERGAMPNVKEEPGETQGGESSMSAFNHPSSPTGAAPPSLHHPLYPQHRSSSSPSLPFQGDALYRAQGVVKPLSSPLEQQFQQFRLETPRAQAQHQHQDPPDGINTKNQRSQPISGPASVPSRTPPLTPTALPDIYIQDYSETGWHTESVPGGPLSQCQPHFSQTQTPTSESAASFNNVQQQEESDFVASLRQGLEPLDDQLLSTLLTAGTFVEPEVEEHFKRN